MRKILLLAAFVMTAGFASAQKCTAAQKAACKKAGVTCTKGKKACTKTAGTAEASTDTYTMTDAEGNVLSAAAVADLMAEGDASIERRECAMSGKVSYFQKSECPMSGKVSMNEVKYCTESQAFVNASPSETMNDAKAKVIKTADTVDGKVQSTGKAKKACCKGKKKCSSKKGA